MWVLPDGTTRGVLTKMPLGGNQCLFIKEVAGRPKLEKGSLHSSLVIVSFSIKEVLPVSNLSPIWGGLGALLTSCLGTPLPNPIFLMIVSPQGTGSSSCL